MLGFFHAADADAYFDANTEIHDTIIALCENTTLAQTHTKMMARARRGRFMAIIDPDRLKEAVGEHEQLMQALRARDADAARRIWRDHLLHTGRTVAEVLRIEGLG
jgi:DNA-binding GntR family transcriptional regulator